MNLIPRPVSAFLVIGVLMLIGACSNKPPLTTPQSHAPAQPSRVDPSSTPRQPTMDDETSYAQPDQVVITHLSLALNIDVDHKQLVGSAGYQLHWKQAAAQQLVLDTHQLTVQHVSAIDSQGQKVPLSYTLEPADALMGRRLVILAPHQPQRIEVSYSTSPDASGLQWLEPSMTEGKKWPLMFSQSQAIHARSWVPLQDTPAVRFTYDAHITSPTNLMVLMSAQQDPHTPRNGDYRFTMSQPIPSYLLAIVAGDFVFRPLSLRSGVWAEPTMVDRAVHEFADIESMMTSAEALYGPYRWERYDLLVLPPSFPFGGMENPRLTFVTPTVVVGDRSLVSLIAHELAHSWSGNLVTNANWRDFWLNEGLTTYVQGRIVESVYGSDVADMERELDQSDLLAELPMLPAAEQALVLPSLKQRDPDDVVSLVAYVKGAWFLQFLEERIGRSEFDAFLRQWCDSHAFQSVSTAQFVADLQANVLAKHPNAWRTAELHQWLYEPGIPSIAFRTRSRRLANVDITRIAWLGSGKLPSTQITSQWVTQQWAYFLSKCGQTLTIDQLRQLDHAYRFTGTTNAEIAERWYPLAIRSGYLAAWEPAGAFLEHVGRRKMVMPIYAELVKTPHGLQFAQQVFARARANYHPITRVSVEKLLVDAQTVSADAGATRSMPAGT